MDHPKYWIATMKSCKKTQDTLLLAVMTYVCAVYTNDPCENITATWYFLMVVPPVLILGQVGGFCSFQL